MPGGSECVGVHRTSQSPNRMASLPAGDLDEDRKLRAQANLPQEASFATKPAITLGQIRQVVKEEVRKAPVLADAGYDTTTTANFEKGLPNWG